MRQRESQRSDRSTQASSPTVEDRMINPITHKFMAQRMQANVHTHDADQLP
jgi:hypothetical protein